MRTLVFSVIVITSASFLSSCGIATAQPKPQAQHANCCGDIMCPPVCPKNGNGQ